MELLRSEIPFNVCVAIRAFGKTPANDPWPENSEGENEIATNPDQKKAIKAWPFFPKLNLFEAPRLSSGTAP